MGKHTQNCTLIGKGVYGTIGVDQRSRLADGAHFHTMIVTSTLEASVIEGDKLGHQKWHCAVLMVYSRIQHQRQRRHRSRRRHYLR